MYHAEVPISMAFTMRIKLIVVSVLLVSCSEMTMPKLPSFTAHKMEINQGNMVTPEMRHKLKLGMTRLQVQAVLGTPLVNDAFHTSRWDYVYRLEKKGKLLEKQRMTLYFEGDFLTRIDDGNMPALPAMVVPVSPESVGEN
jgi:outer membrane protein assembly factor BamE